MAALRTRTTLPSLSHSPVALTARLSLSAGPRGHPLGEFLCHAIQNGVSNAALGANRPDEVEPGTARPTTSMTTGNSRVISVIGVVWRRRIPVTYESGLLLVALKILELLAPVRY
jgi:hypothetical protein